MKVINILHTAFAYHVHKPSSESMNIMPMWYPVLHQSELISNRLKEVTIANESLVLSLDRTHNPNSQGLFRTLDNIHNIRCSYRNLPSDYDSLYPANISTLISGNLVYLHMGENLTTGNNYIHQVPEEGNKQFRSIYGSRTIHHNVDVFTENVLDMLHISSVHFFGNKNDPLPRNISFKQLSPTSGRTTFIYTSGSRSLSHILGRANSVTVENEYYLPSTTVTRVRAGERMIKTLVTRGLPVNDNKSIIFWELHRNFLYTDPFQKIIGDISLRCLLSYVFYEDLNILDGLDNSRRLDGFSTSYDITIEKFRESIHNISRWTGLPTL